MAATQAFSGDLEKRLRQRYAYVTQQTLDAKVISSMDDERSSEDEDGSINSNADFGLDDRGMAMEGDLL